MRYGHPGIAAAIERMADEGCTRILAAPLYPQYCAATTATANDAVFGVLARMRWQPALRTLPPYYDDPLYIEALAANLSRQLAALDFEPERLLLSFHGMPQRTLELGDPYHCHCQKTARLLGRGARPRRRRRVPVALRPREMARAGDRRDACRLSEAGRQAHRGRRAGFLRRLPRNAGGARHPRPQDLPARRRRAIRAARLPQRFARKHRDAGTADRARTCRLAAASNKRALLITRRAQHGTSGDRHRRNARHRRSDQRRAEGHGHAGRRQLRRQ